MAVLAVARVARVTELLDAARDHREAHPKMRIIAEGGVAFEVPYAPRETTSDGFVPGFATVDRAGRVPLLIKSGGGLQTMSMELVFGHFHPNHSIEPQLTKLRALAKSGKRLRVSLDRTAAGKQWRLTGFSQQVLSRQHGTNAPTRALCQLTFTEASDPLVAVTRRGHAGGGKDDDDKRPKFYVIKKGDTLQGIAKRFYNDVSAWHAIADANKIRHPKKLKIGRRIRLPRVGKGSKGERV